MTAQVANAIRVAKVVPCPAPRLSQPIIRWVGGKRWLVDDLVPGIKAKLAQTGGRYVEPFLGGGAVAFALDLPDMLLADKLAPLVETYWTVTDDPTGVYNEVANIAGTAEDFSKHKYYALRDTDTVHMTARQRAARFIVINRAGYNGLYRENRDGRCNVPFGIAHQRGRWSFPSETDYHNAARVFKSCLGDGPWQSDFRNVVAQATAGDVLFCDPPYYGQFSNYTAGGFNVSDHTDLAEACRAAYGRGATVIVTCADTPEVRALYRWAYVLQTQEPTRIDRRRGKSRSRGLILTTDVGLFIR